MMMLIIIVCSLLFLIRYYNLIQILYLKIPVQLLDRELLKSLQVFVNSVNRLRVADGLLISDISQYLLFDFR